MKSFCVYKNDGYSVLINTNNRMALIEDCKSLRLKKGNLLSIFMINNPSFKHTEIPYYRAPYSNEDKYEYLCKKYPHKKLELDKLIFTFDLGFM